MATLDDKMRRIRYERREFPGNPEAMEDDLLSFVYDIPYFGACGIFPPFYLINRTFGSGGSDGGMSPGAIWSPFEITGEEYGELVKAVAMVRPGKLINRTRCGKIQFQFDSECDNIAEYHERVKQVAKKPARTTSEEES
jgi:hypothetical protein